MKAIILAAGRGSRMQALTSDRPKCLVELGGRPLLEWQRASLIRGGAADIAAVTGYKREKLESLGIALFENPRWMESNMVVSLFAASDWLRNNSCIVSYSDIFYPAETVARLVAARGDIVIAFDPNWLHLWSLRFEDPMLDAESFCTNESGVLVDIGRKVKSLNEIRGQYMGLLKITPSGWAQIAAYAASLPDGELDRLDMTSLLQRLIARGVQIHTVETAPGWGEVDSETDLMLYQEQIRQGKLLPPPQP